MDDDVQVGPQVGGLSRISISMKKGRLRAPFFSSPGSPQMKTPPSGEATSRSEGAWGIVHAAALCSRRRYSANSAAGMGRANR